MPKVLLTGGSGFIASHILDVLLGRDYTVVTTVRSSSKADKIKANHPNAGEKLQFAIVEDVAQPGAFDKAVVSDPPFDYVLHTASPFHFNVTDVQKELLDPAIIGTTGILKSIKANAPSVKRVVVTSSFAAIVDAVRKPKNHVYSEADWNGITKEEALENPGFGYRASKTYAEQAAWDFVEKEKPGFDLAVMNPPLVFGPVHPNMQTLDSLNTSNERVRNLLTGKWKEKMADTGVFLYVDVRDLAAAHVDAIEKPEAGGKRFFITAGLFNNKEIAETIQKVEPKYADQLPADLSPGDYAPKDQLPGFVNTRSKEVLGLKYTDKEKTFADTVRSIASML